MKNIIDISDDKKNLYPDYAFDVKHHLTDHPLFSIERLLKLCRSLPEQSIEYNSGNVPVYLNPTDTPHNGLSAEETIRRIAECGSWLVLKNVQQDPEYVKILNDCLDDIQMQFSGKIDKNYRREAFIFISSPHSVTPFHIDPEHNFLLQIRGQKTMRQWRADDESVLPQYLIENSFYKKDAHRNLPYHDDFAEKAISFDLKAGDGVYVPVHAPHWVQNGADVSISLSVTYRSNTSQRQARLYRYNAILRSKGITPRPVGQNKIYDIFKDIIYQSGQKFKIF